METRVEELEVAATEVAAMVVAAVAEDAEACAAVAVAMAMEDTVVVVVMLSEEAMLASSLVHPVAQHAWRQDPACSVGHEWLEGPIGWQCPQRVQPHTPS